MCRLFPSLVTASNGTSLSMDLESREGLDIWATRWHIADTHSIYYTRVPCQDGNQEPYQGTA